MVVDGIPVIDKVTCAVAHGMRILALYQRPILLFGCIFKYSLHTFVHRAIDICIPGKSGTFVLNRPAQVAVFDPGIGSLEITTIACLVAQRPDDYRRVVFIAFNHAAGAVDMSIFPNRVVAQGLVRIISHAVRFNICFIHHVKAIFVAQIIPVWIVGIVTGAYCIDVILFHKLNILQHELARNHVAFHRVKFVPVNPFKLYSDPVNKQLPVFYFAGPETNPVGKALDTFAVLVEQVNGEYV